MDPIKVGIIGCGSIGTGLAVYIDKNLSSNISKIILTDIDPPRAGELAGKLSNARTAKNIDELADASDLIVEAASAGAVPEVLKLAIDKGKDIMLMSIGGLLGNEGLLESAEEKGIRVILPSGAISGVDAIKAAKIAGIESVTLTTRKPPASIKGAPYLTENNIDVDKISGEEVIFEGNAIEAMKGFPKNVNVSAILSLAGIGPERTKVKIMVSPKYTKNSHEIEVKSKAGTIKTLSENLPSPDNPGTSYLAALAAMAAIKDYFNTIRIGT